MQTQSRKMAHFVAGGVVVGGLPLLMFIVLFLELIAAQKAGHPYSGDGIGWAIMSVLAFGLALISLLIGVAYFGYQKKRYQRGPQLGHSIVLVWVTFEVAVPILYFAIF
jgi:hypothetical protein